MKNIKEMIEKLNQEQKEQLIKQAESRPNNIYSKYVLRILGGK